MKKTIQIGTLSAAAGEKKQGYYTLPKSTIQMPVTIVNGCHEGKTVLITSGIHGGEYPGIQTGIQLARELSPQQVHGAVVFIHPVNVSAFVTRSKQVMPEDGQKRTEPFPAIIWEPSPTALPTPSPGISRAWQIFTWIFTAATWMVTGVPLCLLSRRGGKIGDCSLSCGGLPG